MRKQLGFTLYEVVIVLFVLLGAVGWVWNIVKIVQSSMVDITTLLVLRFIGVFVVPLGAILGYF